MIRLLIAGDFSPVDRLYQLVENEAFDKIFTNVKPVIERSNYSIVNFETTVAKKTDKSILKHGPALHCSSKAIDAIKWAGFDMVTLANNHFRDYGDDAVKKSIYEIKKRGLDYVGGGVNINEASSVLYKNIADRTFAFVNVCEHEFSIASENHAGSNPLEPIKQYYQISEAKQNSDYVIVITHGGHEYYQLPSPRMKQLYRFFIDVGADAVINHHQHCYTGYEVYKEHPIFYGIGNFCFDRIYKINSIWNEGFMVELILDNHKIGYNLIPYTQFSDNPSIELMKGNRAQLFDAQIKKFNDTIANDDKLSDCFNQFVDSKAEYILSTFTPYSNRYLRFLSKKGLLPRFLPKSKILSILNYVNCESHRDILIKLLTQKTANNK